MGQSHFINAAKHTRSLMTWTRLFMRGYDQALSTLKSNRGQYLTVAAFT